MRFSTILVFATTALAFSDTHLFRRQQFTPEVTTAEGRTCFDAFGPGYETCRNATSTVNRLCYNSGLGQICCSNSWACPEGSYCSASGGCCPAGSDEKICQPGANNSTSTKTPATVSKVQPPSSAKSTSTTSVASQQFASSPLTTTVLLGIGLLASALALL